MNNEVKQTELEKIIGVVVHEGRRPLSYFLNEMPILKNNLDKFEKTLDKSILYKDIIPSIEGFLSNSQAFVELFRQLDPLIASRQAPQKKVLLKDEIQKAFNHFKTEMESEKITYRISGGQETEYLCWPYDIQTIFKNLIENSIRSLKESKSNTKHIGTVISTVDNDRLQLDYYDTGIGIKEKHIDNIFKPGFSGQKNGTGLGLAITREAAHKNRLTLKAVYKKKGAHFVLTGINTRK